MIEAGLTKQGGGQTPDGWRSLVIIDVRGEEEYRAGHLPQAINIPSYAFPDQVTDLIHTHSSQALQPIAPKNESVTSTDDPGKQDMRPTDIVFHCSLSQVRGPKAARIYTGHLQEFTDAQDQTRQGTAFSPRVHVLRGGFSQWQSLYRDVPHLLIDFNRRAWDEQWF